MQFTARPWHRAEARPVTLLAVLSLTATVALGCTSAKEDDGGGSGGSGGSGDPVRVDVTFEGGEVTPSGERVDVTVGEPVELVVTADEPGEIHVHSDPEQQIPYDEGTETFEIEISRPGVVEVESHDLDQVIVQLEAR